MSKLCTGCDTTKPLIDFHKKKAGKLGVAFFCKVCTVAKRADYRETNPTAVAVSKKKWAQSNPDKTRAGTVRWRKRNPDEAAAMDKVYRIRYEATNMASISERAHIKYWSDPDHYREKKRLYDAANPHIGAANDAKRRARKLNATPRWCEIDIIKGIYKQAADLRAAGVATHVDHIVPLAGTTVCGLHCADNLQLLSPAENLTKGNRHNG